MQAVCFLLSNGKLHPLAKILEACNESKGKKIVTRYLKSQSQFRFSLDITDDSAIDTSSCVFHEENEVEEDRWIEFIGVENGESEV